VEDVLRHRVGILRLLRLTDASTAPAFPKKYQSAIPRPWPRNLRRTQRAPLPIFASGVVIYPPACELASSKSRDSLTSQRAAKLRPSRLPHIRDPQTISALRNGITRL
jgi:hypothetical protein